MKFAAGRVERALLVFRAVVDQRAAVLVDHIAEKLWDSHLSQGRVVVQVTNNLSAQQPQVIDVSTDSLRGKTRGRQMREKGPEARQELVARGQVLF